jgi:DNA polymerase-3 subunit epsilon
MTWHEGSFIAFDTETTGVDTSTARIVQAAVLLIEPDGKILAEMTCLCNPEEPIPAAASQIHGITDDRVCSALKSAATVGIISHVLHSFGAMDGVPVVIYNTPYDAGLLRAETIRCKLQQAAANWDTCLAPFQYFLDPLCIDREVDRYRRGSRKLEAVAAFYGVKVDGAHDARSDAMAAAAIMRKILERYPELKKFTLAELQERQRWAFAQWREHINEYWERTGKPDRVTGCWLMGVEENGAAERQAAV